MSHYYHLIVTQNSNMIEIIRNCFLGKHIITINFPQMILIIINRLHPTLLLVPIWNSRQLRNITIVTTDTDNGNIRCRLILFISCNSNISSCTTSYHNKYHGYGSYIVYMSIFQLNVYRTNMMFLPHNNLYLSIYYESLSYHALVLRIGIIIILL